MLALVEHGPLPLAGRRARFTLLSRADREAFLARLAARGGLRAQIYRGLRDLCMLGAYADPATWKAIGYEGPFVAASYDPRGPDRVAWPTYDALVAPEGALPRGVVR